MNAPPVDLSNKFAGGKAIFCYFIAGGLDYKLQVFVVPVPKNLVKIVLLSLGQPFLPPFYAPFRVLVQ